MEKDNILYTVVKLSWTLTRTGNLSIVNAIVFVLHIMLFLIDFFLKRM